MLYCIADRFDLFGLLNMEKVILHLCKKEKNKQCIPWCKFFSVHVY